MKYIFRGLTVFEYIPDTEKRQLGQVKQHTVSDVIPAFDFCKMIPEDYKLLSEYFDTVYQHVTGKDVELKNVIVW